MKKDINNYIQKITINGETLRNESINEDLGVKRVQSSTFILEKHLLIKGEYKKEESRTRNAIIVWYDVVKRKIMGECLLYMRQLFI
jgi:hypothetical protein